MPALDFRFHRGGLHFPELGLWLDPHERQTGTDRVFVSHAHSDHTAAHREVILSEPTARLMQSRLGGKRMEHLLPFGTARRFDDATTPYDITLLPAGHIFGSAMAYLEAEGSSLLYTGDFKLRRSLTAEFCEPRHADVLVMETTFGRAKYAFPPTDEVLREVIRFCRETIAADETPLLLCYSLGKSQELLRGLADAGLPIMLHETVHKLTQVYERLGQSFPPYEAFDPARARGRVLFLPPSVGRSALLQDLGRIRSAVITGWAMDASCRYRSRADAAFALSDHADFPDLIELVKRVAPKKVFTLHGFAAEFAATLRRLGYEAQALSEPEQLELLLDDPVELFAANPSIAAPRPTPETFSSTPTP